MPVPGLPSLLRILDPPQLGHELGTAAIRSGLLRGRRHTKYQGRCVGEGLKSDNSICCVFHDFGLHILGLYGQDHESDSYYLAYPISCTDSKKLT